METPDTGEDHSARLKALEEKIARAKAPQEVKHHSEEHYSRAQLAWRMVIELVAGLGIGFGIGYGLDSLLGTTPIFLVLFILFGFAAGINVMLRTAREIEIDPPAGQDEEEDETRG